jgi:hypothetical protein
MERHEYKEFMKSVKNTMASEYKRIYRRVSEDPGTAGDQAEENWAEFLRNWLPANYPIVTKGRILNSQGVTSPQVDVLVLHPSYPLHLRDKKHYFAGGVIAAFECKLTLETKHLRKVFENSVAIKKMLPSRKGTLYDELFQLPIFGLLAHSSKLRKDIADTLRDHTFQYCQHPRELPDVFCVADTVIYACTKSIYIGSHCSEDARDSFEGLDKDGGIATGYVCYREDEDRTAYGGEVLGMLISCLTDRMAFEDPSLRGFADYLFDISFLQGVFRETLWKQSTLSMEIIRHLFKEGYQEERWSRWKETY